MYAVNNIFDKFILTKLIKNAYSYNILTMMFDLIPLSILLLLVPISYAFPWNLFGFLGGILIIPALLFYDLGMKNEEASRVASLEYIYPIFVAILAFLFLRETLNISEYLGVFLLIIGAILISYKKVSVKKFVFSPVLILLLGYSLFMAIVSVIAKFTLSNFDFFSYYAWSLIGSFSGAVLMLLHKKTRTNFVSSIKTINKKTLAYVFTTCSMFYIGDLSIIIAFSLVSVSIVSALTSLQPFFTLIFISVLSVFGIRPIKEELVGINLRLKIIAIGLIFTGVYLISSLLI
jgi:drug/metabolite transporter (DMT)-like permease